MDIFLKTLMVRTWRYLKTDKNNFVFKKIRYCVDKASVNRQNFVIGTLPNPVSMITNKKGQIGTCFFKFVMYNILCHVFIVSNNQHMLIV